MPEWLRSLALGLQGGNSPIVVCNDCDLEDAVKGAHEALFFNMVRCVRCTALHMLWLQHARRLRSARRVCVVPSGRVP